MANLERAALKGRVLQDRQELKKLEIKADALVSELRALLDPYADTILEIDTEKVKVLCDELHTIREKAEFTSKKLRKMEEELNG